MGITYTIPQINMSFFSSHATLRLSNDSFCPDVNNGNIIAMLYITMYIITIPQDQGYSQKQDCSFHITFIDSFEGPWNFSIQAYFQSPSTGKYLT